MRQLMISLDKKILDPTSAAARRMVQYGKTGELYIMVPDVVSREVVLSPTVRAYSSGGQSKLGQWWRLYGLGEKLLKNHKIETITVQDPFFIGLAGLWLRNQFKILLEVQLHGDFFGNNYYRFNSGPMNHLRWHIGKYVVRRADRVRVVGEWIRQSLIQQLSIDPSKISLRPIPVDQELIKNYQPHFNIRAKYPGYDKIFLCLGRLDPVKNLHWLLEVYAKVVKERPKDLLLIVGSGLEEPILRDRIKNLKLEKNVKLEGWAADPYSYLKTVDALLFPSLSEGYGLVVMEALAAGCPVIMNDVGVANYEVQPSAQVKILPINDRAKWLQAILSI